MGRPGELRARLTPAWVLTLVLLTSALLALPAPTSPASVATLGAALAVTLLAAAALHSGAAHLLPATWAVSPDAPAADERCRRGAFRRQTSPDARGRTRPRAPQPA